MLAAAALSNAKPDIPGLTSIRGLAAWWVVLFHFQYWLPHGTPAAVRRIIINGFLGVDLFFVLSGYVIALNYADKLTHLSLAVWGRFLWLRIARIYPLHFFMLLLFLPLVACVALFSHAGLPLHRFDPQGFLLSLLLMQNWGFRGWAAWNLPAWSISVEWLAYILFPVSLWLARKPLQKPIFCWLMALASLALYSAITPWFMRHFPDGMVTRQGPIRGLLEFWSGVCLYHIRRKESGEPTNRPTLGLIGSVACAAIFILTNVPNFAVMPLSFFFLVWALSYPKGWLARLAGGSTVLAFGTLSYSTYMVHMYIREWGDALRRGPVHPWMLVFCLALTLVVSLPLYRYIEVPGRRALRRLDLAALGGSIKKLI